MNKHIIPQDVLIAAKNGSRHAFEKIVITYQDPIYRYICTMVGTLQAQDLTQETFLKLYRNINKYNNARSFNAWIYVIARTIVYDWLRKERKRKDLHIIDDSELLFEPEDQTIDPDDAEGLSPELLRIQKAVHNLKPKYKEVIMLYYWNEYQYGEIAELLGVPMNTVKTRLRRAKKMVQEEVDL